MVLDEPKENDLSFETEHLTFLMAADFKDVAEQSGGLVVDFVDDRMRKGFTIQLANQVGKDCGSCGDGGCG